LFEHVFVSAIRAHRPKSRLTGNGHWTKPLATNPLFGPILAAFRPEQRVLRSSDHAGTLGGALVLVGSESRPGSDEAAAPIEDKGLERYRERWIEALQERAGAE
jgi:hypothetical protein